MENLFHKIYTIEEDEDKLNQINKLQAAFKEVKSSYVHEHDDNLREVINIIKNKLKVNKGMHDAVEGYIERYVKEEMKHEAREQLYDMLAAELLQTMQVLSHTSCAIL
jgi:uncharacterized protein YggL (DUF469 family)